MGKRINKEDIAHIANLSEIEYSKDEIDEITVQLDKIIDHVAKISEVDTSKVSPTSHVLNISNVLREDNPRQSIEHKEALKNAPESSDDGFKIPKID